MLFKIVLSFFICWTCFIIDANATVIEGIVFSNKGPLAGAVVTAYPDVASLAERVNGIASCAGEKPGQFSLSLSPGKYYLAATGTLNDIPLFSYHGLNPITIGADPLWVPFFTVIENQVALIPGYPGIKGQVTFKGAPVANGTVSVYSLQEKNFRGMGLLTNSLDSEGRFQFDVEPGSYVVIARKRMSDSGMGPLGKKDFFCYPSANPVQVRAETISVIEIGCYPRDDLEAFLDDDGLDPRGRKMPGRRIASLDDTQITSLRDLPAAPPELVSTISGRVVDLSGKPQAGLFVAAYPASKNTLFQMYLMRLITQSITKTDDEGHFQMTVDNGGTYFLLAREKLGEAPERNEYYGLYEGEVNHSITLAPGEQRNDVQILVEKIMP